jgi:two-component system chemotaxis response regulator CheY
VYTIGEISKIVNISPNTLRYYDEIGLLKPSLIQNNNQYRYYSDMQIKELIFILELKQYGFTLREIKELMHNESKQKFKQMLEEKHIKLNKEIERLRSSSILLDKRIKQIINEEKLNMEGKKILIVDDLELARIMIKDIIEEHGYISVAEVSNGKEAIVAYEQFKPDLVIMDIVMPVMDGIDAVKEITKKYCDAKIIMCSAMSSISVILDSIKAGALDFISKPLSNTSLINSIERNISNNCFFETDKFEDIFNKLVEQTKESIVNKPLMQKDINIFINDILQRNCKADVIRDFTDKIHKDYVKIDKYSINQSVEIEENIITYLKDRVKEILIELSNYLFEKEKKKFLLNLLTVESITMSEFRKLVSNDYRMETININDHYSNIYVHLSGNFNEGDKILKEIINFAESILKKTICENIKDDIITSNIKHNELIGNDYSIVLVSFDIKTNEGNRGFIEISIPHSFLEYLP